MEHREQDLGIAVEATRASQFASLVALELECARLRLALDIGPRVPEGDPLALETAWALIASHAADFISVHSADGAYVFASQSSERLFGHAPSALIGRPAYDFIHPDDLARVAAHHATHVQPGSTTAVEYRLRTAEGGYVWVETRADASRSAAGVEEIVCITRDVSARHEAEEAQKRLIVELERRAEQVRQLSGLLPMCAWCKSIRDYEGYWHQVEAYFHRNGHLEFTHGACPSCASTLRKSKGTGGAEKA